MQREIRLAAFRAASALQRSDIDPASIILDAENFALWINTGQKIEPERAANH
jgi:hypothetical protein